MSSTSELLDAWDDLENACQRAETSLPIQMSAAIAGLEAARLNMREVIQRHALRSTDEQAIRDRALEEAAEVAVKRAEHYHNGNYVLLAADIRALKGAKP